MTKLEQLNTILTRSEILDNSSVVAHYQFDKSIRKNTTKDGVSYCYIDAAFKTKDGKMYLMVSDYNSLNVAEIRAEHFTARELKDIISHITDEVKAKI